MVEVPWDRAPRGLLLLVLVFHTLHAQCHPGKLGGVGLICCGVPGA